MVILSLSEMRQKHVEAWSMSYAKATQGGQYVVNGSIVRSAIDAGIVTGIEKTAVDEMLPYQVGELAEQVSTLILDANKPPEKN